MSKERFCLFCESVEWRKRLERNFNREKEEKKKIVLSVALVEHTVINGEKRGRITDYMKQGEGFPLRFCPMCGERVKNE